MPPTRIAILATDGVFAATLMQARDFFHMAGMRHGKQQGLGAGSAFQIRVLSPDGLAVTSFSEALIPVDGALDDAEVIILPAFWGDFDVLCQRYPQVIPWLRERHAAGSAICGEATGVFWMAQAGLLDGKRALFLSVVKAQGRNTVDTVDGLVRMTDEVRKLVPAGVQLNVVNDTARGIRSSVKEVRSTLLEGAFLTVAIVFLFLGSSALGVLGGGILGDRIGRNKIIWFSILGALPFALMLPTANLFWTGVLTIVINVIMSSAFAAILIYAMDLLPGRVGLVGGFFYGLTFGLGGIAAALLGGLADRIGIEAVYRICSFLPAMGLLAWFLPTLSDGRAG